MNDKPNILMYVADQMRSDSLHHLGNKASFTPGLDGLLKDGVSFQNTYCQNPVCVPSRCSFLSGFYPHTTGHRTMHYLQRPEEENILKTMKRNGYEVIWIGRNDVLPDNADKQDYCDQYFDGDVDLSQSKMEINMDSKEQLYSFYIGEYEEHAYLDYDWNCVNYLLSYLEKKAGEKNSKPFFIYCTLTFPHPPYICEKRWFQNIENENLPKRRPNIFECDGKASMLTQICEKQGIYKWTEAQLDEIRTTYLAMVSRFDHQLQRVCDKLKEQEFYDDTNILVFSDHGDYTTDYGIAEKVQNCFEDPVSNVPLIVKPSKNIPVTPRISSALVELLDIPATLCDMAGIELGYIQFGVSLLPVLAEEREHKDAVFCEGGRIHGEIQAAESGHGPQSPYWPRLSTQSSEGPEHTKACMIRVGDYKYTMRLYEQDEFYDLKSDPMETHNCIRAEHYQDRIHDMRLRLLRHYMETADCVPVRKDKR